ncbi:uncharacterized protein LOC117576052 [Drosophila albomicans]|uniref:Uncharacterized protein LOC117576052 n=1 Tax=Drosophila albomicans TaxID=7291 RepID=A0A6P8XTF4_DROAB|nr:uncharacterized protein LOC117576052 [Drosophila albomicans]
MSQTPCGKCTACPCSTASKKDNRAAEQQRPPPKIDCQCATRRQQSPTAPVQAPLADTITCVRPKPEPVRQVPMEERCTCRIKPDPVQCECPAPAQPPERTAQEVRAAAAPPTHQQVICGQQPQSQYHQPPQYTPVAAAQCGHCRAQKKKKKCIIQ